MSNLRTLSKMLVRQHKQIKSLFGLVKAIRRKMAVHQPTLEDAVELGYQALRNHPTVKKDAQDRYDLELADPENAAGYNSAEEVLHEDANALALSRIERKLEKDRFGPGHGELHNRLAEETDKKYGLEYSDPNHRSYLSKKDYNDTLAAYYDLVETVRKKSPGNSLT